MSRKDVPFLSRFTHDLYESFTSLGRQNKKKEWAVSKTLPSTFTIITLGPEGPDRREEEIGSGFVVKSTRSTKNMPGEVLVATNKHVIQTFNGDTSGQHSLFLVTSGAKGDTRDEALKKTFANAEIAYVSKDHDLAFIRLPLGEHPDINPPALKLGYSTVVDVPDTLLSIGAPLGVEDTVTEINVSQNNLTKVCSGEGCDLYRQISIANKGNSGGAVIDPLKAGRFGRPEVVGMVTLGAEDNPTLGYMLAAETIKQGLEEMEKAERGQIRSSRRGRTIVAI